MMALFIVLWLMNASVDVKRSVSGYFRDPKGFTNRAAANALAGRGGKQQEEGQKMRETAANLRAMIEKALRLMPDFDKVSDHVQLSVTNEGLRIELMEKDQATFFMSGRAEPTDAGRRLLDVLAGQISKMPNAIVVEGHTDSAPFRNATPNAGYTNWELSADRANSARRMLCQGGIPPRRIVEVRGFADQRLIEPAAPDSSRNRRVSIVVRVAED
jgi:chemotaxis protein MotB